MIDMPAAPSWEGVDCPRPESEPDAEPEPWERRGLWVVRPTPADGGFDVADAPEPGLLH